MVKSDRAPLLLVAALYPVLFVWQGLDVTDMGYCLSGYQKFISSPASMESALVNWLTFAIGSVVEWTAGDLGVIAFRFAAVFVNWISLFVAYRTLRAVGIVEDRVLLLSLSLLSMAFITCSTGNWLGYDNLTAVFYVLGGTLLYFGLVRPSRVYLACAGFVLGTGLFVRLPNLLGFLLVSAVVVSGVVRRWNWRQTAARCMLYVLGYVLGIAVVLLAILYTGHIEYYLSGLRDIHRMADGGDYSYHSLGHLMGVFLRDHLIAFASVGIVGAIAYRLTKAHLNASGASERRFILWTSAVAALILPIVDMWRWVVTGFCYAVLLLGAYSGRLRDHGLLLLAVIAGLVLLLAPLGSSNGIRNAVYGGWLAFPLSMALLLNADSAAKCRFFMVSASQLRLFGKMAVCTLLLFSLVSALTYTFRDSRNRLAMRYAVDHPLLRGIFTTKERAVVIQELLYELGSQITPGERLLAYNHIPLVYYLLDADTYMGSVWPQLNMPDVTEGILRRRQEESVGLPVVVRPLGTTLSREWPMGSSEFHRSKRHDGNRRAFGDFIDRYNYRKVWANEYFEVLRAAPNDG